MITDISGCILCINVNKPFIVSPPPQSPKYDFSVLESRLDWTLDSAGPLAPAPVYRHTQSGLG